MPPIIQINNIGKKYSLAVPQPYLTLRDIIGEKLKTLGRKKRRHPEEFWALKEINLDIEKGERIGIIGRNGAGKSTLLKVLSRITPPTTGVVRIRGRIASLLEVGTGFHPELTGRENIFFNGSILGLSKKEISSKLDEIVDFSGVEKFIDTPLKQYSSGMQLRLAFSVAAHLEPEILLIDEVLAVGDMEFQKKCMGKMEEVSRNEGRTILFVSHNMSYISSLCNRAVLLDSGHIDSAGPVNEIVSNYIGLIRSLPDKTNRGSLAGLNACVRLISVKSINAMGAVQESFRADEPVGIKMEYEVLQPGLVIWLGHNVHNENGINVFDTHSVTSPLYFQPHDRGKYTATVWIPGNLLNVSNYYISTAIFNHQENRIYLHEKDILFFHVHDVLDDSTARGKSPGDFPGVVRPLLNWSINKTE